MKLKMSPKETFKLQHTDIECFSILVVLQKHTLPTLILTIGFNMDTRYSVASVQRPTWEPHGLHGTELWVRFERKCVTFTWDMKSSHLRKRHLCDPLLNRHLPPLLGLTIAVSYCHGQVNIRFSLQPSGSLKGICCVCMRRQHNCGYPRVKIVAANVLVHFVDLTLTVCKIHKIDQIQDNTCCYVSWLFCWCSLTFPRVVFLQKRGKQISSQANLIKLRHNLNATSSQCTFI